MRGSQEMFVLKLVEKIDDKRFENKCSKRGRKGKWDMIQTFKRRNSSLNQEQIRGGKVKVKIFVLYIW